MVGRDGIEGKEMMGRKADKDVSAPVIGAPVCDRLIACGWLCGWGFGFMLTVREWTVLKADKDVGAPWDAEMSWNAEGRRWGGRRSRAESGTRFN